MASRATTPAPAAAADASEQQQPKRQSRGNRSHQRGKHHPDDTPEVRLSKLLSFALRHGAAELKLDMRASGYVALAELLAHRKFRQYSEAQIEAAVRNCPKQRFSLTTDASGSTKFIRANQGHSLTHVRDDELLEPITRVDALDACIHGTYAKFWDSILSTGLSRMTRNHIHFTTREATDGEVVSGMRATCDLLLYIDVARALGDGVAFFRSANNVVLSPGIDGVLDKKYFLRAIDRKTGNIVYDRDDAETKDGTTEATA